jgi:hypothetical protein
VKNDFYCDNLVLQLERELEKVDYKQKQTTTNEFW